MMCALASATSANAIAGVKDEDTASLPLQGAKETEEGRLSARRGRGEIARKWCQDVITAVKRFVWGSSDKSKEVLYLDARGHWCDVNGVDANLRQPISVLPLARLAWEKKNGNVLVKD